LNILTATFSLIDEYTRHRFIFATHLGALFEKGSTQLIG